jgi:5-carboxymethyl-2-hydroxymuconate isomerase
MAQFIVECARGVQALAGPGELVATIRTVAEAAGLFQPRDIKVRVQYYDDYCVGAGSEPFLHLACKMYPGRSPAQKRRLTDALVRALCALLPSVAVISAEVVEMDRDAYSSRVVLTEEAA